jgi:hypothetical protein
LGLFCAADPGSGTWDMYVSADQTIRNEERGQRRMAVEVAGERYFTVGKSAWVHV